MEERVLKIGCSCGVIGKVVSSRAIQTSGDSSGEGKSATRMKNPHAVLTESVRAEQAQWEHQVDHPHSAGPSVVEPSENFQRLTVANRKHRRREQRAVQTENRPRLGNGNVPSVQFFREKTCTLG